MQNDAYLALHWNHLLNRSIGKLFSSSICSKPLSGFSLEMYPVSWKKQLKLDHFYSIKARRLTGETNVEAQIEVHFTLLSSARKAVNDHIWQLIVVLAENAYKVFMSISFMEEERSIDAPTLQITCYSDLLLKDLLLNVSRGKVAIVIESWGDK